MVLFLTICYPCQLLPYFLSISQLCEFIISAPSCFITEKLCIEHQSDPDDVKTNDPAKQPTLLHNESNGWSEECCSRNGICSHEVLRDGKPGSDSKMLRKVFYKFLIEA